MFAVNPNAREVEGHRGDSGVAAIPGGVEAVVIATHPDVAAIVVRGCTGAGVRHVWMHRAFGRGSVDPEAVCLARHVGLAVIAGACPMMFIPPVDPAHACIRWLLGVRGGLPTPEGFV